jgi:hypothetical protein
MIRTPALTRLRSPAAFSVRSACSGSSLKSASIEDGTNPERELRADQEPASIRNDTEQPGRPCSRAYS